MPTNSLNVIHQRPYVLCDYYKDVLFHKFPLANQMKLALLCRYYADILTRVCNMGCLLKSLAKLIKILN